MAPVATYSIQTSMREVESFTIIGQRKPFGFGPTTRPTPSGPYERLGNTSTGQ